MDKLNELLNKCNFKPYILPSVLAFNFIKRPQKNVKFYLHYIEEGGAKVVALEYHISKDEIMPAFPLIVNNQLVEPHKEELFNYECDICEKKLGLDSLMCETCNYDLCEKCKDKREHEHKMIEYKGYYGINTYERKNIKSTIEI